jgi:rhodanese-related sulfurtransferase
MKYLLLTVAIAFSLFGCNRPKQFSSVDEMVKEAKKGVKIVTAEELKVKIDSFEMFNLIDVREPSEYNHGYIPGAVNIPRGTIEFNISSEKFWESTGFYLPEKKEEFVLYCKKGSRSILAAEALKKLGFENISIIEGGFKKWELTYPLIQEKNLDLESHDTEEEVGGC